MANELDFKSSFVPTSQARPAEANSVPALDFESRFVPKPLPNRVAKKPDRTWGEAAKDTGLGIVQGAVNILGGVIEQKETMKPSNLARQGLNLLDKAGVPGAGRLAAKPRTFNEMMLGQPGGSGSRDISRAVQGISESISGAQSPALQHEKQALADTKGFWGSAKKVVTTPQLLGNFVAEQVPNLATIGTGTRMAAGRAAQQTLLKGLKNGLTQEAAETAAGIAGKKAATAAATGMTTAMETGSAGQQAYQQAMSQADEVWQKNPEYQRMLSNGVDPVTAKETMARAASMKAQAITAPIAAVAGRIAAPFEADVFTRGLARKPMAVLGGMGREAIEETIQEGGSQLAGNIGVRGINPDQKIWEGVAEAAGTGGALGAVLGGGMGAGGAIASKAPSERVAKRPTPPPLPVQPPPLPPKQLALPAPDSWTATPDGSLSRGLERPEVYAEPEMRFPQGRGMAAPFFPDAQPGSLADAANIVASTQRPAAPAASPPAGVPLADANSDGQTLAPQFNPPRWVDPDTGEYREPSLREIKSEIHARMNQMYEQGRGVSRPNIARAMGLPSSRFNKAWFEVAAERRKGLMDAPPESSDTDAAQAADMEGMHETSQQPAQSGTAGASQAASTVGDSSAAPLPAVGRGGTDKATATAQVPASHNESDTVRAEPTATETAAVARQKAESRSQVIARLREGSKVTQDDVVALGALPTVDADNAARLYSEVHGIEVARARKALPDIISSEGRWNTQQVIQAAQDAARSNPQAAMETPPTGGVSASAEANTQKTTGDADTGTPHIAVAAAAAATSPHNDLPAPTQSQKEAGNYAKGHVRVNGHDISIENPAGSKRDPKWPALKNHYGYIRGTVGRDKDHVDVFLTDHAHDQERPVFVIDQVNKDGSFDEHKVVMGTLNEAEARKTYLGNYSKGWTGLGGIKQMSQEEFKAWVRDPAKTKRRVTRSTESQAAAVEPAATAVPTKPVPEMPAVAPKVRRLAGSLEYVRSARETLQAYFQPGRILGQERVESFDWNDGKWRAAMQPVDQAGHSVPGAQPRKHSSLPSPDDLKKVLGKPQSARARKSEEPESTPTTSVVAKKKKEPAPAKTPTSKPAATAAPEAQESIKDLGEKIGGARKDLANTSTSAEQAKTAPPKYDVAPTRDGRFWVVRHSKSGRVLKDVRGWSSQLYATEEEARQHADALNGAAGDAKEATATWRKRFTVLESVGATNPDKRFMVFDTKTNRPLPGTAAATMEAAEKLVPIAAVALKHRVYSARNTDDTTVYEIWRNVTDRKRVKVVDQQFPTRDDAMTYMAKHAAAILETNTRFGEEVLAKPETVRRIGEARRTGDVKGPDFIETFGFRGVEFGNWNNQAERQEVMNHAYDGLLDLAELLQVPPRALTLNGELSLAFGARGQGLTGARAHYERNYGVINLTKMKGAGSLAHEWMHALDHYLGRRDGKASSDKVKNERGDEVFKTKGASDYLSHGTSHKSGLRPEVIAAYRNAVQTIFTKSEQFVEDTEHAQRFVGKTHEALAEALQRIRANLASPLEHARRKNKPATAEQMAEFDTLAAKLMDGPQEYEHRYNAPGTTPARNRAAMAGRWTNDTLEAMSGILKEVRGITGFKGDRSGLLDGIRSVSKRHNERLSMLAAAQNAEQKTKRVPTRYAMDAKAIDQGAVTDYWTTEHEMMARAFSSYVEDRLEGMGNASQFLSYGSDNRMYRLHGIRPFPEGTERVAINDAFDNLFQTLQTEETDQGVALFSAPAAAAQPVQQGLDFNRALELKRELTANWGDAAPSVVIVQSAEDFPASAKADPTYRRAEGLYDGRPTVWLNASAIASEGRFAQVLAHEAIGHYGVERIVGKNEWGQIIGAIDRLAQTGSGSKRLQQVFAAVEERYPTADRETFAKEAIAVMAERGIRNSFTGRLTAAVRRFLRRVMPSLKWSEAEVRDLLSQADGFLHRGRNAAERREAVKAYAFSANIPTFGEQVAARLKSGDRRGNMLWMGKTPPVLRMLGFDDLPLRMPASVLFKLAEGKGGQRPPLTERQIMRLPELIDDPAMVLDSATEPGSLVVVTTLRDAAKAPVVVTIKPNGADGNAEVNVLTSAYGKDKGGWIDGQVAASRLRYADAGKSKGLGIPEVSGIALNLDTELGSQDPMGRNVLSDADLSKFRQQLREQAFSDRGTTSLFSLPESNTLEEIDAINAEVQGGEGIIARGRQMLADLTPAKLKDASRPKWLGAFNTRQLTELGADHFKNISHYSDYLAQMQADRNTMQAESEVLAKETREWAAKNKAESEILFGLMHEATIKGVDPAEDYKPLTFQMSGKTHVVTKKSVTHAIKVLRQVMKERSGDSKRNILDEVASLNSMRKAEPVRARAYASLVEKWNQLSPEAQAIYKRMRDAYKKQSDAMEQAHVDMINDIRGDALSDAQRRIMVQKIRQQYESNRLQGVYFPLHRAGDHYVAARRGDETTFQMYNSENELERAVKGLSARGWTITSQGKKSAAVAKDAPSGTFVAEVIQQLRDAKISDDVQDQIYQLYLETLPELSMRKHRIHRRAVPGFDPDALKAFAHNMHHGSHQLARLRYAHKLQGVLELLQEQQDAARKEPDADTRRIVRGDNILEELKLRHDWIMNPQDNPLTNLISSFGFVYYLGLTPAAALVNLTQTALVTYPHLAARFGGVKSMNYLLAASKDAVRTMGDIQKTLTDPDEIRAHKELLSAGAIDKSQAHHLAGIAEGGMSRYNPAWSRAMEIIGWGFHKTEVVNREATGIAAYRLARSEGMEHDAAVKIAGDTIWDTHFDYSNANRARYLQGGMAKMLFMFRQYSFNMLFLLGRTSVLAWKGESPEVKRIARRQLTGVMGMSALFSGVLGLPMSGVVMGVLNALAATFGDDDEPYDAETEFRAFLSEMLGPQTASVLLNGPINKLTGADIAGRVGLSDLVYRDADRELDGRGAFNYLLEQISGPMGGVLKNAMVGKQMIDDGHTWRGVETVLPKSLKDMMKAARYATQGVNTLRGDPVIADASAWDVLMQGSGFASAKVAEQYDRNRALTNYTDAILKRRQHLMDAFAMSLRLGDSEGRARALEKIRAFNRTNPEVAVTPESIRASIKSRTRYSAQAEGGIVLNKKLAARARAAVGE